LKSKRWRYFLDIPFANWYPAIQSRRSRRQYNRFKEIPESLFARLKFVCSSFRPFTNARAEILTGHIEEIFTGVVGSYGKIKDAKAVVAFIGDINDKNMQEKTGYIGEGIVLEATALGLATCWVGGFFRPSVVSSLLKLAENERVLAVTPVGFADSRITFEERAQTAFGRTHKRKPLASLVTGMPEKSWPLWLKSSLEAARLSPSAINRQPWIFRIEQDGLVISVGTKGPEFKVSKRLDCGIAMLHLHTAALYCGIPGRWEFKTSPDVAKFLPDTELSHS
jgi:hypothetical protein